MSVQCLLLLVTLLSLSLSRFVHLSLLNDMSPMHSSRPFNVHDAFMNTTMPNGIGSRSWSHEGMLA